MLSWHTGRVTPETARDGKRVLRTDLLRRRRELTPEQRAAYAERLRDVVLGLPEIDRAGTVATYVSVAAEPGTGPLLDALAGRNVRVLLPVTLADMTLDWAVYSGPGSLVPAGHGLTEPTGPRLGTERVHTADVVLLPALAVDGRGMRMGRGGGCYDRVLAALDPAVLACALLYEHELVPEVPVEPHDRPVAAVATPSGLTRFP